MSNILVINASGQETRVALIEQGTISEYYLERKNEKGIVGNIYKGRVVRVLPGMQAAFVDIGLEKAAFLYVGDIVADPTFPGFSEEMDIQASGVEGDPIDAEDLPEPSEDHQPSEDQQPPEDQQPSEEQRGSEERAADDRAAESERAANAPPGDLQTDTRAESPPLAHAAAATDAPVSDATSEPRSAAAEPEPEGRAREDKPESRAEPSGDRAGEGLLASPEQVPAADAQPPQQELTVPGTAAEPALIEASPAEHTARDASNDERGHAADDAHAAEAHAAEAHAAHAEGAEIVELHAEDAIDDEEDDDEDDDDDELDEADAAHAAAEEQIAAERAGHEPEAGEGEARPAGEDAAKLTAEAGARGVPAEQRPAAREGRRGRRRGGRGRRRGAGDARTNGEHPKPGSSERPRGAQGHERRPGNGSAEKRGNGHKRAQIQDLIKEGDEVLVQVVKDPIGTKGARITCHISLPGRHLVFMPTVDHVGISRRIENEKERRRLRELVDKYRPSGTGFIVRTVAENEPSEKLTADIKFLLGLWNEVGKKRESMKAPACVHPDLDLILRSIRDLFSDEVEKLVIDDRAEYERVVSFVEQVAPELKNHVELYGGEEPIFDEYGIEQELIRAQNRKVWLKSGGYIIIDQTEALVAIDVNSGRYVGKKGAGASLEDTITKINCEAAKEIVYQLRLRNIGGIIIIDFIDMDKGANREKVFKTLQDALAADRAKTNVLKISDIGLVEMTRKRVRESIGRLTTEACPVCDGRGHVRSRTTMTYDIMREVQRAAGKHREDQLVISCHPEVAKLLQGPEREALRLLMMKLNKSITVRPQPQYHVEQYDLHAKWSRPELQQPQRGRGREGGRSGRESKQGRGETKASEGTPARMESPGADAQAAKVD
jgi:ribonuclease G